MVSTLSSCSCTNLETSLVKCENASRPSMLLESYSIRLDSEADNRVMQDYLYSSVADFCIDSAKVSHSWLK